MAPSTAIVTPRGGSHAIIRPSSNSSSRPVVTYTDEPIHYAVSIGTYN